MCVYSMVVDHYKEKFPWVYPAQPSGPAQPTEIVINPIISPQEADEIRKLVREFKEALKAAKTVDNLTDQPDCEDPQKAELVKRVEALEKKILDG